MLKLKAPAGFAPVLLRDIAIPGYWVSANGEIWSGRVRRVLKTYNSGDGYRGISLRMDNNTIRAMVHWLVAEAFIGKRPLDMDVCHHDGDRTNNKF